MRRSTERSVIALVFAVFLSAYSHFVNGAVEPAYAMFRQPLRLHVEGVQQPYVTCVTTFSGKESQAVVATRHDSSLVCTLLPPESNASYTTATVHIQTRPPQPGKHPGVDLQHKVRFIQPPIVHNVLFKYAADVGEHIEVVLNKAAPLQKVDINHAFRLQIDLSAAALATLSLPVQKVHFTGESSASLIFPLSQSSSALSLPAGAFPCQLFLGQQPVSMNTSTLRGSQRASGAVQAGSDAVGVLSGPVALPPLAASPEARASSWLQVLRPVVRLVASGDATADGRDDPLQLRLEWQPPRGRAWGTVDPQAAQVLFQVACGRNAVVAWGDSGSVDNVNVSLLQGVALDVPPASAAGLGLPITDVSVDVTDFAAPISLAAPQPDCAEPALTRVSFPQASSKGASWRLELNGGDYADFLSQGLAVVLAGAAGAAIAPVARWAAVPPPSSPGGLPEFEVEAAALQLHRGETGSVRIVRRGGPSPIPSRVGWRMEVLPDAAGVDMPEGASSTHARKGYDALRPAGSLAAALGMSAQGVALWPAGSATEAVDVALQLQWAKVPYGARWAVTVRLSGLENARVSTGGPPIDPLPGAQFVVLGTPRGACGPGSTRLQGPPAAVPVLEDAAATADTLGSLEGFFVAADRPFPSSRSYSPPLPPYQPHRLAYELAVPHDAANPELVLLSRYRLHTRVYGCGAPPLGAVATWTNSSADAPGALAASWKLPLGPGAGCLGRLLVCPTATPCKHGSDNSEHFSVFFQRRFDPALAKFTAVRVSVGDAPALRICGVAGGTPHCPGSSENSQSLVANLTYRHGEHIRLDVESGTPPGGPSQLVIGQRIFRVDGSHSRTASVELKLYDEAANLSPFLPFFVRSCSASTVVLDVPISLTLPDRQTSTLLELALHLRVLPALAKPESGPSCPTRMAASVDADTPSALMASPSREDTVLVSTGASRDSLSGASAPEQAPESGTAGTEPHVNLQEPLGNNAARRSVLAAASVDSASQQPEVFLKFKTWWDGAVAAERSLRGGKAALVSKRTSTHRDILLSRSSAVRAKRRRPQSTLGAVGALHVRQAVQSAENAGHSEAEGAVGSEAGGNAAMITRRITPSQRRTLLVYDGDSEAGSSQRNTSKAEAGSSRAGSAPASSPQPGSSQNNTSSSAANSSQAAGGNEMCEACPAGSFSYSVDTSPCLLCPPGSFAAAPGLTDCIPCSPGTYSSIYASTECLLCLHGSFAAHEASSACQLCPVGFTSADGAIVCDKRVEQTFQVGRQYGLSLTFSLSLTGPDLEDLSAQTGIDALPIDIMQFLVSLDAASALNVSTADVGVTGMQQLSSRQVQANVSVYVAVNATTHSSRQEREAAFHSAHLQSSSHIHSLRWMHTTDTLGSNISVRIDGDIQAKELSPSKRRGPSLWKVVALPVLAGVIILGSAILLRIRISRGNCMQQELQLAELQLRFPSELIMGTASFFNATLEPFMQGLRRSSFVSAGDASECNDGSSQRLGQPRERKRVGNGREPGGFVQP